MRSLLVLLLLVVWSVESNLITKQAWLSSRRDAVGGIQVEEHFYFPGGFEFNDQVPTNIIDIYNITSGEWEEPLFLEEPRGFISSAVSGQNIYFVGGARALSCAMLYNSEIHQYEDIGCGPTVRNPIQLSNHNGTLTVLGSFSADFFNTSKQWYNMPDLTSWMQQIGKGALLVHENLIIGIGGVNTTTLEQIYDTWIFDTTTNNLTVFINVTTSNSMYDTSGFTVAHGWIVIYVADRYFVHQFGTTEWHEVFMAGIWNAVILNDVMILVNSTGSMIYDLTTMAQTWRAGTVEKVFAFDNQAVLYAGTTLSVYENAQWNTVQLTNPIDMAVRWGDKYVLHCEYKALRLYDPQTKTVSTLSPLPAGVRALVPFNETILVIFIESASLIYNINDDITTQGLVALSGDIHLIGTDIVSYPNRVWINLTETASLTVTVNNTLVDGPAIYGPIIQDYMYIEVLNYVTRQWQPKISIGAVSRKVGAAFASVFVIEDTLIIGRGLRAVRCNLTTGVVVETLPSRSWPTFQAVNTVAVINNTAYIPGTSASLLFTVNSTWATFRDILQLSGVPNQFVTYNNTIYLTAANSGLYNINTLDIFTAAADVIIMPTLQASLSLTVMNDTLVALGNDGSIYGLLLSDRLTWYKTPWQNNFIRTITVAMQDGTFMLAGGRHYQLGSFTDEILFINTSAVIDMGTQISIKEPSGTPGSVPYIGTGNNGLTEGELAAAIVVPIVVVIAGIIALVVVLLKRRNGKNNRKSTMSTTQGLESRYGTWFIPFNQITFGDQLGQGSSGQVFKGTWKNTTVALKVSMTQANTTVISELELMMQLRPHPNVVQLLGFSVHPETDSIILIIEFCEDGSLDSKLYDDKRDLSFSDKVQWLLGIAKGLSHLHSNNIVHRDVAARNVLLHRNEPKLTDFGMSRLVDEQKQHGTTKSELGPIRWMSPESLKNKEYSAKSDIWSFGILVYEAIARQEPHIDKDPIEIGRLIRDSGLTPVIPSTCHHQLAEIMKQCWQMSPQSRPTIESVVQMLESVIAVE